MTTPNQPPPANLDYVYQISDMSGADDHTESGIEQLLGVGVNASWGGANTSFNNNVASRFVEIEDELIGSGAVLSNHENRITVLESDNAIAEYFSNDIWTKPTTVPGSDPPIAYHHHDFIGVAGGGGGRRPGASGIGGGPRGGSYGGGQGGHGVKSVINGLVGATVTVVIGTPGAGATSNATDGGVGGAATFTGGVSFTCNGGPGGIQSSPGVMGDTDGTDILDWNANGGRGAGYADGGALIHPTSGGNGYLADGGTPGNGANANGANGGACPAGRIGPGGGGGGGDLQNSAGVGSRGGHGGFPGGAGGAGGANGSQFTSTGNGGNGAIGRSVIISYVSAS